MTKPIIVGKHGEIVIPKLIRKEMHIEYGSMFDIEITHLGDAITLKKIRR